ncbi:MULTISPECIES: hypothetical protein [unclassified Endozoicomonas]|uniref:hypothetical protein n=1 Tax=unclassified Endozoicomonas TaxID=2644528 RepID=UPI0021483F07|nr:MULTISPECIES: hypothetical protein [unclassified Endozoicomonas]
MSQVGQTGASQNTPVDYGSQASALAGSAPLDEVGRGDLDGENLRYSREAKNTEVLKGQQKRAPELDKPGDVKPTHLETANSDVNDISKLTQSSLEKTQKLAESLRSGNLNPQQQQQLQRNADLLKGSAGLLSSLHGHNLGTAEGKRSVLAGMGFSQSQLDALMSLADPDDAGNSLASMHGGQSALQGKKDALKSMGFSESQVDALLSLADPDDEGNSLTSTHQTGSGKNKSALTSQGFSNTQAERLTALLNGQTFGTEQQKDLLKQMGFSDPEADVLLATADPQSLKTLDKLARSTDANQLAHLQEMAKAANVLSTGSPIGDRVLQQLVDIFTVFELLHEMSVQGRRTARETRAIEYDAAKQEVLHQAGEMRKAAIFSLAAGMASGVMKIGAGAVAIRGASGGGSAADRNIKMQLATQKAQMVTGVGDIISAGFNYQSSEHQARQKEHEAFQKTHENAAQSSSEWMQMHQDMVKTVQSKMDEIIRTWFETLKTTTRG